MKKILFLGSIMMMLLAACSTHESSKEDNKSKSNQNNVQKAKKNESDKKVTGYQYEPWHLRYLGKDTATKVYQSGKTLEEYVGLK